MEEHKADRIFLRRYPALALLIFACGGIVFFSLLTVAPVYLLLLTALSACAALVLALSFSSTKKAGPHIPASAALMLAVFFLFGYLAAKTPQTPVLNDENFYEVRATIRDISEVRDILLVSLCDVTAGEVSIGDASTSVPLRMRSLLEPTQSIRFITGASPVYAHDSDVTVLSDAVIIVAEGPEPHLFETPNRTYLRARTAPVVMATRTDMPLTSVRNRMRQLVRKNLPGPAGGLVQAVTLGVRDEIAPHWAAAFLRTGNGHLLAVSGLHAGVVCAVAFMLAALLGLSIWGRWIVAALFSVAFLLLIGFNPPSVRATLMVFAALASVFAGRPHNSLNSLALAILVILAIQPHALFEPSLQLSASAICGILILGLPLADTVPKTTILDRWPKRYRLFLLRITAVSLGAWAFTNPLAAFHFGQVNPFAFLYALVAVPLLAALVCSSFLMLLSALVTGGAFAVAIPAQACAWLLALLNRLLELVPLGCSFMRPLSLGLAIALMLLLVAGSLAISLRRMNLALALFALGGVLSLFALYNPAKSGARELDSRYGRSLLAVWQDEHLVVFDHAARSYTRLRYLCAKNSLPPPSAVVRLRPVSALQDRRFPVPLLLPVSFAPASNAYSAGTVVEVGKMRAVALAPRRYPAGMLLARPQLAVGAWTVYLSGD